MTKQKTIVFMLALALLPCFAGCALFEPANVGTIGEVEISSGLYRLAQYNAYQQAADLAANEQNTASAKSFLNETITAGGEPVLVSDYVACKTLEELQIYAAIETRFAELGGTLTAAGEAQAASYARQLYEQYGETYKANGIDIETLKRYELILLKNNALLTLIYGPDGETPVNDEELTAYLQNDAVYVYYTTVPLYNTSSYAFASESEQEQMLALAAAAANAYNRAIPSAPAAQAEQFEAAALAAIPEICSVIGNNFSAAGSGSSFAYGLFNADILAGSFTDTAAASLRALDFGEAAAMQYSSHALMLAVRLDPIKAAGLDALRTTALSALKGDELTAALKTYGAQLPSALSESAMQSFPASKIAVD